MTMRALRIVLAFCLAIMMTACIEVNYPTAPTEADTTVAKAPAASFTQFALPQLPVQFGQIATNGFSGCVPRGSEVVVPRPFWNSSAIQIASWGYTKSAGAPCKATEDLYTFQVAVLGTYSGSGVIQFSVIYTAPLRAPVTETREFTAFVVIPEKG